MPKRSRASANSLPKVWCDFNSAGWSGEDDDECYYAYDEKALEACRPRAGMRIFIYEPGSGGMIMGCEAVIEAYNHPITGQPRWRLRPVHETGYMGGQ